MSSALQFILLSCLVFAHSSSQQMVESESSKVAKETIYDINLYITIPASFAVLAFLACLCYCLMCSTCKEPESLPLRPFQPVIVSNRNSPVVVSAQHCSKNESPQSAGDSSVIADSPVQCRQSKIPVILKNKENSKTQSCETPNWPRSSFETQSKTEKSVDNKKEDTLSDDEDSVECREEVMSHSSPEIRPRITGETKTVIKPNDTIERKAPEGERQPKANSDVSHSVSSMGTSVAEDEPRV